MTIETKMMKKFYIFLFALLINSSIASAYEFLEVNKLYRLLGDKHETSTDFRSISIKGAKTLNDFDKDFRLFNSHTKAYLYYKNNLVKVLDLPTEDSSAEAWRTTLTDILSTYNQYSSISDENKQRLEKLVIKNVAKNIDKNSRIEEDSLKSKKLSFKIKNNIIYISSQNFYNGLADDIKKITSENTNTVGLILDLRNNKGGDFAEAVKVADLFLDNSLIAYSVENGKTNYYNSSKGDVLEGKQIVVLVNNKTASAAEIVTAALGEQSRATIIGTKTYGKGSIQSVYHIDNRNLYVTSGFTYTPSGKMINEAGIIPQICTGIQNSCKISDNKNSSKDILLAINLIKNSLV